MLDERILRAEEMKKSLEGEIEKLRQMLGLRRKSGELIELPVKKYSSAA